MFAWEDYSVEIKDQAKQLLKESTVAIGEVKEILALAEKGEDSVTGEKLSTLEAANMRIACIDAFVDSANDLAEKFKEIGYEEGAKCRTELGFRRQEWVLSEFFKEGMKDFARELEQNPDDLELQAEIKTFAINLVYKLDALRKPIGRTPPCLDVFRWELKRTIADVSEVIRNKRMSKYHIPNN